MKTCLKEEGVNMIEENMAPTSLVGTGEKVQDYILNFQ